MSTKKIKNVGTFRSGEQKVSMKVTISGETHYLGFHDSEEDARQAALDHAQAIAEKACTDRGVTPIPLPFLEEVEEGNENQADECGGDNGGGNVDDPKGPGDGDIIRNE